MMKLFYSPGACSLAVHIALQESGLPFQIEKVDMQGGTTERGGAWKEINPKGYVPALQLDDGQVFTEGAALQQVLADKVPGKLLPMPMTTERYRAVEWLTFIGSELHKSYSPLFGGATGAEADTAKATIAEKVECVSCPVGLLDCRECMRAETQLSVKECSEPAERSISRVA